MKRIGEGDSVREGHGAGDGGGGGGGVEAAFAGCGDLFVEVGIALLTCGRSIVAFRRTPILIKGKLVAGGDTRFVKQVTRIVEEGGYQTKFVKIGSGRFPIHAIKSNGRQI